MSSCENESRFVFYLLPKLPVLPPPSNITKTLKHTSCIFWWRRKEETWRILTHKYTCLLIPLYIEQMLKYTMNSYIVPFPIQGNCSSEYLRKAASMLVLILFWMFYAASVLHCLCRNVYFLLSFISWYILLISDNSYSIVTHLLKIKFQLLLCLYCSISLENFASLQYDLQNIL